MNSGLSANTQAILLLTAPLKTTGGAPKEAPLTAGEYKRLARHLREVGRQPADLLDGSSSEIVAGCFAGGETGRVQALLDRGFLLAEAVAQWNARAIWVASRADPHYPRCLKAALREDAPPILYGCGAIEALDAGGVAVVGSREADEALLAYARSIGALCAQAGQALISGGARGIDQAAMQGALGCGGSALGILADSLQRAVLSQVWRDALQQGRLTLVSPYDPQAGFNVGHAMRRNRLIYALADAALVVNADLDKGGTWAGATEALAGDAHRVFVRSTGPASVALEALRRRGARPWPNPEDAQALASILTPAPVRLQHALPL